jgi:hypothetical protein
MGTPRPQSGGLECSRSRHGGRLGSRGDRVTGPEGTVPQCHSLMLSPQVFPPRRSLQQIQQIQQLPHDAAGSGPATLAQGRHSVVPVWLLQGPVRGQPLGKVAEPDHWAGGGCDLQSPAPTEASLCTPTPALCTTPPGLSSLPLTASGSLSSIIKVAGPAVHNLG